MLRTTIPVTSVEGHRAELALLVPPGATNAILWLPAMGVPARKYMRLAESLAQRGIATALHEWRGVGTSDARASRSHDWGYAALLGDVEASRAAARHAAPAVAWRIGGHSLGAQLAALALALAPGRYAGLVVVGAGLPWWRAFPPWQRPLLLGVLGWFSLLTTLLGYFPGDRVGFAGREARGVIRDWVRSALAGRYRIDGMRFDFDAALASLDTAVVAVHFSQDRYVPSSSLEALTAKLPRSRIERIELVPARFARGRADHFAWMRDPDPVTDALSRSSFV